MGRLVAIGMAVAVALTGCGSGPRAARSTTSGRRSAGIPSALLREARPIGRGVAFHPPARGPVIGACQSRLGARDGVHVELFAVNRVVLVAAGIGVRAPRRYSEGRIIGARCYGALVTLDPTGVVLVRAGARLELANLFRSWGEPLSSRRLASFRAGAGAHVAVFVNGRRRRGPPGTVALDRHSEIVLEVGPPVPPHSAYTFPPGS